MHTLREWGSHAPKPQTTNTFAGSSTSILSIGRAVGFRAAAYGLQYVATGVLDKISAYMIARSVLCPDWEMMSLHQSC